MGARFSGELLEEIGCIYKECAVMEAIFYTENRTTFAEHMEPGELAVFLSGELLRKSADDDYGFWANGRRILPE